MKIRLMHPAVGEIAIPIRTGGSMVVGRLGAMTDVEISWDPRISRRHCRLWEQNGRVWFEDLASRNGSWIGSDRISGAICLESSVAVLIGETILRIAASDEPDDSDALLEETHERPLTHEEALAVSSAEPLMSPAEGETQLTRASSIIQSRPSSSSVAALRSPSSTRPSSSPAYPAPPPRRRPSSLGSRPVVPPPHASTADLRESRINDPLPRTASANKIVRSSPRMVDNRKVLVRAHDRNELRQLWTRDISKGGLFIETPDPPPPDTELEVQLETPEGSVRLRAVVVHVLTKEVAANFGGQSGVGVQFTDLDPKTRDTIQAYVEGLASTFHGGSGDLDHMPASESEKLLQRARQFLRDAENRNFYEALELHPNAPAEQINAATQSLHHLLSSSITRVPPPQAARLSAALNVLGRVRRVLSHEEGRLEYDFRNGYVRAEERIQAAKSGKSPSLSILRKTWNRVFPERVDRAALLTRKAFAARQKQDMATAIDAGRSALELNPFFEELKQTVEVWESAEDRKGV